ncbi:MAG: hypothetical protein R3C03_22185 [Pirellulaceae bacterium]
MSRVLSYYLLFSLVTVIIMAIATRSIFVLLIFPLAAGLTWMFYRALKRRGY